MTRNDEIRERLGAATPGPWVTRFIYRLFKAARNDPHMLLGDPARDWADAELIAHAPADLAHLLAENERQAQRIERLERVLAKVHPCMNRRRNECGDCLGEIEGAACPPDIWTGERVEAAMRGAE